MPIEERDIIVGPHTISFRPVDWNADAPFMAGLMTAIKGDEAIAAGMALPWETLASFGAEQSRLQTLDYRRRYPDLVASLMLVDAKGAGRIYLDRAPAFETRIVDITLTPSWRGKGIGGAVLAALLDEEGRGGKRVTLTVRVGNVGARRLYDRLGFVETGRSGDLISMKK